MRSCRYRVAAMRRDRYLCQHPAVRARGGIVTPAVCAECTLVRGDGAVQFAARALAAAQVVRRLLAAEEGLTATAGATDGRSRDGRPRVGFVTPNLVLGGAERWVLNMLRYVDGERIALSGVCLLHAAPAEPEMCIEASQFAPVFGGPVVRSGDRPDPLARSGDRPEQVVSAPGHRQGSAPATGARSGDRLEQDSPPVIRLDSVHVALAVLCRRSDVIVAWGSPHFARLIADQHFGGQVVVVAHGSAPSTVEMLATSQHAAQHLVGVSRASAAAFRDPRARVIHNGADAERCAATVPREETRGQWGAAAGEILVGYVGRFSWEKNPLAAALAVRELNGRGPHPNPLPEGEGAMRPHPNPGLLKNSNRLQEELLRV